MRLPFVLATLVLLFAAATQPALAKPVGSLEPVTLQLKWKHQFQFAGYYAAVQQGYYREAGLDVTIREAQAGEEPVDTVLAGRAQYGVGTTDLLLKRHQGAPVVVLGVIFQHSPLGLVARVESGIRNLHDLVGKRVALEPHSAELLALLQRERISAAQLQLVQHSFNTSDLVTGTVDAMSVYTTDELFALHQAGIEYRLFEPGSAGIDFYGDNLFTTREELQRHPQRVAAFYRASMRGWAYAMSHTNEMVELILERYSDRHSREHLLFEAREMQRLIQPQLIEPGYMHEGRWRHVADTYARFGMLPADVPLDDFLYQPQRGQDLAWLYWLAAGGFALAAVVGGIGSYIFYLHRRRAASEAHYRAVYEAAPLAFVVWDRERRVVDWNRRAEVLFGWRRDEVLGRDFCDFMVPQSERAHLEDVVRDTLSTRSHVHSVNRNLTRDGDTLVCEWMNAVVRDSHGEIERVVALGSDITERKRMEEELQHLAHFDMLTGLPNRALFFDRLERIVAQAKRNGHKPALLFLDLDEFKPVNDRCGHHVGDQVLQQVGNRLAKLVRGADTVARLGGDEFAILLHAVAAPADAERIAGVIIEALAKPYSVEGHTFHIGASVGIALYPEHGTEAEILLTTADQAMYEAKRAGRHRYWMSRCTSRDDSQ